MSKDKIAGFMIGLTAGYVMGYLLQHPEDESLHTDRVRDANAGSNGAVEDVPTAKLPAPDSQRAATAAGR